MGSKTSDSFHVQLASIVEVLANSAVAEICKLVDDGYAVLHLEISQNQKEIDSLRRKLLCAKLQNSRRNHADTIGALRRTGHASVTRSRSTPEDCRANGRGHASGKDDGTDVPVIVKVENIQNGRLDGTVLPSGGRDCERQTTVPQSSSVSGPQCGSFTVQPGDENPDPGLSSPLPSSTEDSGQMPVIIKVENIQNGRPDGTVLPSSSRVCERRTEVPQNPSVSRLESFTIDLGDENPDPALSSPLPSSTEDGGQTCLETNDWDGYHQVSNGDGAVTPATSRRNGCLDEVSQRADADANASTWINSQGRSHAVHQGAHSGEASGCPSPGWQRPPGAPQGWGDLASVVSSLAVDAGWEESVPVKEEDGRCDWLTAAGGRAPGDGSPKGAGEEEEGRVRGGRGTATGANQSPPLRSLSGAIERKTRSFSGPSPPLPTKGTAGLSNSLLTQCNQLLPPDTFLTSSSSSPPFLGRVPAVLPPQYPSSKEGRLFRCDACGKTFTTFPSLRRHERVHTGEKPFGCRHCAKHFSLRHQLKTHERVHTGEKPFRCHVCGRCFVQSNHRKKHLQTHRADGTDTHAFQTTHFFGT